MAGELEYYLESLADLALPRHCIVCGRRLETRESHLCIYCAADFPFTFFWNTARNEMSDRYNALINRDIENEEAVTEYERYSNAAALFFYHSEAGFRKIPQLLKYRKRFAVGRHFAGLFARMVFSSEIFRTVDMVVPVPLHRRRLRERGYNQTEILAGELGMAGGIRVRNDLLKREKYTVSQTRLGVEDKKSNVRGAFSVAGKIAAGCSPSHILVVDDVFTTGATITACHHALRGFFGPRVRISAATLGFVSSV